MQRTVAVATTTIMMYVMTSLVGRELFLPGTYWSSDCVCEDDDVADTVVMEIRERGDTVIEWP